MKKLILATILITLINPARAFAQKTQSPLLITSHEIRVEQHLHGEGAEQRTFYYSIKEDIQLTNTRNTVFKGPLKFWVGNAEELQITKDGISIQNPQKEEEKDEIFEIKDDILEVKLDEEEYLKKGNSTNIVLKYREFFIYQDKEEIWTKKINYPHSPQSLKIQFNTVESGGFYPYSKDINFEKSKKYGHITKKLTPQVGDTYNITTIKKEPSAEEVINPQTDLDSKSDPQKNMEDNGEEISLNEIELNPELSNKKGKVHH